MVFALGIIAVMANFSAIERMAAIAKEIRRREAAERKAKLQAVTAAAAATPATPEEALKLR